MVWKQRGTYPSLSKVFNHFLDDDEVAADLAEVCSSVVDEDNDLLSLLNNIGKGKIPKELKNIQISLMGFMKIESLKRISIPLLD